MVYKRRQEICAPSVTLSEARDGFYIHKGTVYPVSGSPSHIFREAVLNLHPRRFKEDRVEALVASMEIDVISRWYIILELATLRCPMKLYDSRFDVDSSPIQQ